MESIIPLLSVIPHTTKTIVAEHAFFDGIMDFCGIILAVAIWSAITVLFVRIFFKMDKIDALGVYCISLLVKTICIVIYNSLINIIEPMIDYEYRLLWIPISILIFSLPIIVEGNLYNLVLKYKKVGGIKIAILTECLPPMIFFVVTQIIGLIVHPVV